MRVIVAVEGASTRHNYQQKLELCQQCRHLLPSTISYALERGR